MTASVETAWWVVTDLDGTLLDHGYDWSPAKDLIRQLQQQRIPVIPCTSKTAEEVRGFPPQRRGFMTRTSLKTVAPCTVKPLQGSPGSCRWAPVGRSSSPSCSVFRASPGRALASVG